MNILFYFFILIVSVQLSYYLLIFSRFSFFNVSKTSQSEVYPVSIIICAKNEAKNLQENLPFILNQKHTDFELVLVDDNSTDATLAIMQHFKEKHKNIVIVTINDGISNKKKALTKGIQKAKNKHLLLTDADCKPVSKNWINEMLQHFNTQKTIVLGYGAHQKIKNSWLNKLIRFETLLTAIQYFSYAKIGLAYMGVGRNIAYLKTHFNEANGFSSHKNIKSGDDDLFVNQISNKQNTAICFNKDSFTISKPHFSFKKWILQKQRHITTATYYKPIHQLLLGLFYISQFLFWFLAIFLLLYSFQPKLILILVFLRIAFQYLIYGFSAKKLNETDLIVYLPFLELFLIIIQMYIFTLNSIKKPKHW